MKKKKKKKRKRKRKKRKKKKKDTKVVPAITCKLACECRLSPRSSPLLRRLAKRPKLR